MIEDLACDWFRGEVRNTNFGLIGGK